MENSGKNNTLQMYVGQISAPVFYKFYQSLGNTKLRGSTVTSLRKGEIRLIKKYRKKRLLICVKYGE